MVSFTHVLELAGEPLVLFGQLGDEEALLLLRRPLAVLRLVEQGAEAGDVAMELRHLEFILLLCDLKPPPEMVLLLLQLLKKRGGYNKSMSG